MSLSNIQPRTGGVHNLVVCGAANPESNADGAMFGDFMGICLLLQHLQPEFMGTFLSCFPLEKHFDFLGSKTPPITDIKWTRRSIKGSPFLIYTREEFERSPSTRWYQYVITEHNAFYIQVVEWIRKQLNEAQPGDTVNLFFQCNGTEKGIILGDKILDDEMLVSLLRSFRNGVQVNAIGSHCHSEYLPKAIRKDKQSDQYIVNAAGQKQFHYAATRAVSDQFRNFQLLCPESPESTYSYYTLTSKSAVVTELSNVLLRDYTDIFFQEEVNPTTEQILPSFNGNLKAALTASSTGASPAAKTAVQTLVTESASLCNEDLQDIYDMSVFDNLYHVKTPNYNRIMKFLYWRATQMYTIWGLFVHLTHRGFLSMQSLVQPMEFRNESDEVFAIMLVLYCFEYATTDYKAGNFPQDFLWPMALKWLAVTIVRSAIKPVEMFDAINDSGALGKLNINKFEKYINEARFPCDPLNMAGDETPSFGFWLPHGLGNDSRTWVKKAQDSVDTFQRVQRAYFDYFQVSEEMMAEEHPEQVETLSEHPLTPPTPIWFRHIQDQ